MTKRLVIAFALLACGLAACSKQPETAGSADAIPPGATASDATRDVPYTPSGTRSYYTTDRPGTPPRSGLNSDPNNPSGAPGSSVGPNIVR